MRALPRQLHPLDPRRLDRDALFGHAIRPLRRRGRADTRAEGRHPLWGPRRAPGAEHLHWPACARWCLAARAGSASSPRRRSRSAGCRPSAILGYLFPTWADGLAAMRDIAASEASPSVTRVSDPHETAFSFATRADPTPVDRLKSRPCRPSSSARAGIARRCACRSSATRAARPAWPRSARRPSASPSATALCIGSSPGELYDQEVRHALHPRLPARPRRTRRRLGDLGAMGELQTVYDNVMAAGHGAFRARRAGLPDVPSVPLLPRWRLPLLHVRDQPPGRRRRARDVWRGQAGDPAGVRRLGRDALPSPRRRHGARPVARGGHLEPRGGDAAGALRGFRPGGNLNPGKIVSRRATRAGPTG